MDNTLHRNDTVEVAARDMRRLNPFAALALAAALDAFTSSPDSVRYVRLANATGTRLSRVALVFDVA